jgi:uncharacterized protein (DUF302 family)
MKHLLVTLLLALAPLAARAADDNGLLNLPSPYPVAESLDRLEKVVQAKGAKVFTRIDHAAESKAVGMDLRPTQLLIFGNPKAGNPLMRIKQSIGLDLPMRVLAWEDENGKVTLTWNNPEYLAARHGTGADSAKLLPPVVKLIEAALK